MSLVFFGSGTFAATVLERISTVHAVQQVIAPPPAPAAYKMQLTAAAQTAKQLRLPVIHCITAEALQQSAAQAVIVCDYGKILPPPLLAAANTALNVHPSLLPRWRGAAPIERALLNGDTEIGVTIMQMNERLDAGDILAQQRLPLTADIPACELRQVLARKGADLLLQVLAAPQAHPPQKQDESQATYADKITRADCCLNFFQSAAQCLRQVLALAPQPAAECFIGGERLRVLAAAAVRRAPAAPGTLLAADTRQGIVIACGSDSLAITRLQRNGRKAMPAVDFLRGKPLAAHVGEVIGS